MDNNSVHNTVVGHNCTYHTIDMQYYGCYILIECRKAYQEPLSDADSQHTLQLWAYHAILRQDYLKKSEKITANAIHSVATHCKANIVRMPLF